jgi:hypothetical protein
MSDSQTKIVFTLPALQSIIWRRLKMKLAVLVAGHNDLFV